MFKKTICIFISFLFIISSISIPCTAADEKLDILIMGDSIPYGYLLANGEKNYGELIEDYYNGKADVTNIAVNGYSTSDLLELIDKPDTKKLIKNADVVIISIGANDLLNVFFERYYEIVQTYNETDFATAAQTIMNDKDGLSDLLNDLDKGTLTAINNIPEIKNRITTANNDTKIIFQTIYNPFESISENPDYTVISTLSFLLNNLLFQINKEIKSLDGTETADIYALFKNTGWLTTNICDYDIHPNQFGHVAIAAKIISMLSDDEQNYKKLCVRMTKETIANEKLAKYRDIALSATDDELRRANTDIINSIGVKIPEPPQTTITESHTVTSASAAKVDVTTTVSQTTTELELTTHTTTQFTAETTAETSIASEKSSLQSTTYESSELTAEANSNLDNESKLELLLLIVKGVLIVAFNIFVFLKIKRK